MARRFWVDWSDSSYPNIRDEADAPVGVGEPLMTFAEAKAQIVEKFENDLTDARAMLRKTRRLRAADIKPWE